ncbi:unnamed protein product [Rotaria sp. Silwood1]|nr:unnamed protein product [Rotaria sp. Silwood1]
MSSSTSDSFSNVSLFDKATGCISSIQEKKYFTKKRFHIIRQYFFRFVGICVILYFSFQLLLLFNLILQLIFHLLFQILSIFIFVLFKFIQLFLPKTTSYNILYLLIGFCSILSFFIAKFSYKNIEIRLGKRYELIKRYSFIFTFIAILLLQSVLILLPTTVSIQEQRKLSSTPVLFKQSVTKLPEPKVVGATAPENINRGLNVRKREEQISISSGIKTNENGKIPDGKLIINLDNKLSSSSGNDSEIESSVEDDHSYHTKQDINIDEKSTVYLRHEISPGEGRRSLLEQELNYFVDPAEEISSKIFKKSSEFIQEKSKQTKEFLHDILKEEKIESFIKSKLEKHNRLILHQKLSNWLDEAWNIWHQIKHDFQKLFSLTTKHTQYLPRYNVSSIYTAYTDLHCYDYRKITYHYFSSKQKYIYFLDTYRHHSPFPIYLSILKSNGPKCYRHYPNSSCAIDSKLFFSNFKEELYRFTLFSIIISIPIIILLIILKNFQYNQYNKKNKQLSNKNQQIISNTINDSLLEQTFLNKNNNNYHLLDEKIAKELYLWLEYEQNNGYQYISEACRMSLNNIFSKNNEQLNIETLQFANAAIHDVSQASVETIVIHAVLDIVHLIFNIVNTAKYQHYSIEIPKLTGELEIFLTSYTDKYSIEVKFKQIQIDHAEIIDTKNILSSEEKESFIKLFKETIRQTVVQLCCNLAPNNQENVVNESKIEPSIQQIVPELSNVRQPCATPLLPTIIEDNQSISCEKQVKKLLVRIINAVKLHGVEQPFCIIELNQPRQTHQTSIAKNGLNPYWNESFLFDSNDKSNQIHLKIMDRKKPNKKHNTSIIDKIYADVSIPFSYITSEVYKHDVQITPQYPDSTIHIEVKI